MSSFMKFLVNYRIYTAGARVVFPHPGSSCFWEAWKRHSYHHPPRDHGVRGASIVRMWTLVFDWPELGLISPVQFFFMVRIHSGLGGWIELINRQQQQELHQTKEISCVLEISGFSIDFCHQITVLRPALGIGFLSFGWDIPHFKISLTRLLKLFGKQSKIQKYAHSCKLDCEFFFMSWGSKFIPLPASGLNNR